MMILMKLGCLVIFYGRIDLSHSTSYMWGRLSVSLACTRSWNDRPGHVSGALSNLGTKPTAAGTWPII